MRTSALFTDRFERFSTPVQVTLGVLAFAIAVPVGAFIPSGPLRFIITLGVIAPLSVLLVVMVASAVQQARNTMTASHLDAELGRIRHRVAKEQKIVRGITPEKHAATDPAWSNALAFLASKENFVLATGRKHCRTFLDASSDVAEMFRPDLKSEADRDTLDIWVNHWRELRAGHPTVAGVESIRKIENAIYMLVGVAVTGVNLDRMRAVVDLDRDFTALTDCEKGHWDVHSLERVFTAPGGQRRAQRSCACGSRWSEKI